MLSACAINKVILMGRLTADPELRQTNTGISTCRFTVAVDGPMNQTTNERRTDFITVVAWRQTAEFVSRYFNKGKLILVEGSLRTGSYDDKKYPDVKHYTCEVVADSVSFGETKSSSQSGGGGYAPQQFSQPRQNQQSYEQQSAPAPSLSMGELNDFVPISGDDDGGLPF